MAQVVCTGFWKIWHARNAIIFNQKEHNPQLTAQAVSDSLLELNWNRPPTGNQESRRTVEVRSSGYWVVQSDAGCFENAMVSLGCVVKNPRAEISLAACKRLSSYADAGTAELLGIKWAMQVAKELKLEKVCFQSDAMVIVDCINGSNFIAALEPVILDCKSMLAEFNDASLLFLSRNCNSDAHHMVGVGRKFGSGIWVECIPLLENSSVTVASAACS